MSDAGSWKRDRNDERIQRARNVTGVVRALLFVEDGQWSCNSGNREEVVALALSPNKDSVHVDLLMPDGQICHVHKYWVL